MKRRIFLLLLMLSFVFVSACGKSGQDIELELEQEQPIPTEPEPEEVFKYEAPLTGLGTNQKLPNRAVMVMMNNAPEARPQSGLDQADVVYEVLAEGSITRFVGIYHSGQPKIIGPVRSIRPYYIDIGSGYDAIMVHAGGSPDALATMKHKRIAHLDEIYNAGGSFWRESFRKAPHNLYTDLDHIWKGANALGFRKEAAVPYFSFKDSTEEASGVSAEKIDLNYSGGYRVAYEYDEQTQRYKRFTSGKPHTDLTTGDQLAVTNLLVITAKHRILDSEGRRAIDVYGPGVGYLFQHGKAQEITWEHKNGMIRAYINGNEAQMYPGNTWVNIMPSAANQAEAIQFSE
ncbi:hypothetical protein BEP19_15500 [Ammoniphilus oxalaticus]|uniref:Lipoprotein YerB n=1 Tax=Ammoniphilus oxalaticus TaxID=66863 RepID=A0A419SDD1_9BACL|nr:DUF3048 domain-containing protein [Ammoniphilus oxalaticus]RKD21081.1 hypothetical protein BEP19_15500 [Ammoniphilus oxalaticus]